MNACERADDDSKATQESRFKCSMLTGRALPIIVVTNYDPFDSLLPIVGSGLGYSTPLACDLILYLICLAIFGINCTN